MRGGAGISPKNGMIEITNEAGLVLELGPGQALTFEQGARWLGDGRTPGGFSYPIGFPLTDTNKRFLQHAYRADTPDPAMAIPVSVRIASVLHRRCTLSYRIQNGVGDGFLKIDGGEAADPLRSLSLRDAVGDDLVYLDSVLDGPYSLPEYMKAIAQRGASTFPCTFFPLKNDLFFEKELSTDKVPGFVRQPYVNLYGSGPQGANSFQIDSALNKGFPVVPFFYLTDILNRVFARIGYRPGGDWLSDPETLGLTIYNNTAIDAYRGRWAVNRFAVRVRDHLPDMSVSDFLKALRTRFGLLISFDSSSRTVLMRRWLDIINSQPQEMSPFQLADYSIEEPTDEGVTLRDYIDESDEIYRNTAGDTVRPDPLVIGAGGREETLSCGTLPMAFEPRPAWNNSTATFTDTSNYWLVPVVRQAGNIADDTYAASDRQPDKNYAWKNNVGLRLISYRGFQPDSGSVAYPLGTSGTLNAQMAQVGTTALELTGNRGSWRQGLRQYYFFRDQTQLLTVRLRLPAPQFSQFRFDAPVALLLDKHRRTLLPERYQAQSPGVDGLLPTALECYTLPTGIGETAAGFDEEVWVELIVTNLGNQNVPLPSGNIGSAGVGSKAFQRVEVKLWRNAARTIPSLAVIDLLVLRAEYKQENGVPYALDSETLLRYQVAGPGRVLEIRTPSIELVLSVFGKYALKRRFWRVAASERYKIIKPQ